MKTPLRALLVDDHSIVREGLKRILVQHHADIQLLEAASGFEALEHLRTHVFDVMVMDLSMPGMSGLDLLQRVRTQWPRLRVLVLSMHAEAQYAVRAFKLGAHGFVTKGCAAQELAAALDKVASGGVYVTSALAEQWALRLASGDGDGADHHSQLSNRELDVLRRLVAGQKPFDIAKALHLSVKTVSSHKSRIMRRLQLPNLVALVRYGIENGLGPDTFR